MQRRAAERVYAPSGAGYHEAAASFAEAAASTAATSTLATLIGDSPIVLAPMVRGSELAFRMLVRRHGVRLCYSPMLKAELIVAGDRDACWRFYSFENNLIEEDASKLIDPRVIDEAEYAEAQSVSFFEARLFLKGTFETPVQLLGERLRRLAGVRTWVVQGTGDEVCPEVFAQTLVAGLKDANVPHTAYFFPAGHSAKSDEMSTMLRRCVDEFTEGAAMQVPRR